jgi:hypothetical protein
MVEFVSFDFEKVGDLLVCVTRDVRDCIDLVAVARTVGVAQGVCFDGLPGAAQFVPSTSQAD